MGDLSKRCRLCYDLTGDEGIDIFLKPSPGTSFSKTVAECLHISLKDSPKCPRNCCNSCMDLLFELKIFRGKIMLTQDTLRTLLSEDTATDTLQIGEQLGNEPMDDNDDLSQSTSIADEQETYAKHTETPSMGFNDPLSDESKLPGEEDLQDPDRTQASNRTPGVLSKGSQGRYQQAYNSFLDWKREHCFENGIMEITNMEMLSRYCVWLLKDQLRHPSNIPAVFSMLKTMVKEIERVELGQYSLIKKDIDELVIRTDLDQKQASTFTREEVIRFLANAPEDDYLVEKIVFIFTIWGEIKINDCRGITPNDIKCEENRIIVSIRATKKISEIFSIPEVDFLRILNTYCDILDTNLPSRERFFHGLVVRTTGTIAKKQPMGEQSLKAAFRNAAIWLGLPNPSTYTGMSGQRTANVIKNTVFDDWF